MCLLIIAYFFICVLKLALFHCKTLWTQCLSIIEYFVIRVLKLYLFIVRHKSCNYALVFMLIFFSQNIISFLSFVAIIDVFVLVLTLVSGIEKGCNLLAHQTFYQAFFNYEVILQVHHPSQLEMKNWDFQLLPKRTFFWGVIGSDFKVPNESCTTK